MNCVTSVPVLSVSSVHKSYRKNHVLRGASLSLEPGTVTGLTGENGSGKSTLLKTIVGLLKPDSGSVRRTGSIGYCPQEPVVFDSLSMNDNVRYFAAGYGLTDAETKRQASQLMERLGCSSFANERLETLSGGTRQKLNLILSLLHDPDLIVLDEPYQGFDYESYIAFWGMADDLRLRNKSVLVVSHLIFDRDRLDQVKTLVEGQIESDRVSQ